MNGVVRCVGNVIFAIVKVVQVFVIKSSFFVYAKMRVEAVVAIDVVPYTTFESKPFRSKGNRGKESIKKSLERRRRGGGLRR